MNSNFNEVERSLLEALDIPNSNRRDAFLDTLAPDVQREVKSLLSAHTSVTAQRPRRLDPTLVTNALRRFGTQKPPQQIGGFKILDIIGEGGMGVVYRAEQEVPRRTVALKVIRPGFATERTLQRFEYEVSLLGRLQHPNIAQIYEANTNQQGPHRTPYFAMEYIEGQSLRTYGKQAPLSTRRKLELFSQVIDAVHYAHQNGIVHRDLKPENILIDYLGRPKILDFGVAKSLESDSIEPEDALQSLAHTLERRSAQFEHPAKRSTDVGQLIGTLDYMSPEQASNTPGPLDIRSDVYSLGVVLYEFLSGDLPYPIRELSVPRALNMIRLHQPLPFEMSNKSFSGDLKAILTKALQKDKDKRYRSAAAMGEDLERCLRDEPISARQTESAYRLRKFVRRNRLLTWTGVCFSLLMIGSIVHERLDSERRKAEVLGDTLESLLNPPDNYAGIVRPISFKEHLDKSAKPAVELLADYPLIQARVDEKISHSYLRMGEHDSAEEHILRVLATRSSHLGPNHIDTTKAQVTYAYVLLGLGRFPEARVVVEQVYESRKGSLGEEHELTIAARRNKAIILHKLGQHKEARSLFERILATKSTEPDNRTPETLSIRYYRAVVLIALEEYTEAERVLEGLVAIQRNGSKVSEFEKLTTRYQLARARMCLQKHNEARELLTEILGPIDRDLGAEHPIALMTRHDLATTLTALKSFEEAKRLTERVLGSRRQVLGNMHPDTITSFHSLGLIEKFLGQFESARDVLSQVVALREEVLGEDHPDTIATRHALALTHADLGDYIKASELLASIINVREHVLKPDDPEILRFRVDLASVLKMLGEYSRARRLFEQALDSMDATLGRGHALTLTTRSLLKDFLTSLRTKRKDLQARIQRHGDPDLDGVEESHLSIELAAIHRALHEPDGAVQCLEEALANAETTLEETDPRVGALRVELGLVLLELGKHQEAEAQLLEVFDVLHGEAAGGTVLRKAIEGLVELYDTTGNEEGAMEYRGLLASSMPP